MAFNDLDVAIPPTSELRPFAAAVSQPASADDQSILQLHRDTLTQLSVREIIYRDPTQDQDIAEAVYRWDDRDVDTIFRTGFQAREPGRTHMEDYYDLQRHVNEGGAPADITPADPSVFVSTTRSTRFRPLVESEMIIYRYEIFAPGGIDTVLTLGEDHSFPNQQEIAFVGAVDRQYIRSARPYVAIPPERGQRFPGYYPYGNRIYRNGHFNPNPTAEGHTTKKFMNRLRNIVCPIRDETLINVVYRNRPRRSTPAQLSFEELPPPEVRIYDPSYDVASYVDCAFNVNSTDEAFMFTADRCLWINTAPGSNDDFIIKGPMSVAEFFPALQNTIFATGVDAAFTATETNLAYLFRNNIYVLFNYDSGQIIQGPRRIADRFQSLKGTVFEHGIDAAFASHRPDQAYLFRGDQYALINFATAATESQLLHPIWSIALFSSWKDTVFADGFDAGFRARETNRAYIFKGDNYAKIDYAPGANDTDRIVFQVTPIAKGFPSVKHYIPSYPCLW